MILHIVIGHSTCSNRIYKSCGIIYYSPVRVDLCCDGEIGKTLHYYFFHINILMEIIYFTSIKNMSVF